MLTPFRLNEFVASREYTASCEELLELTTFTLLIPKPNDISESKSVDDLTWLSSN